MGLLNNSGDIILDAVLTDTGRMRLAKGDGSFKISKFALADDEIDYSLYNPNTGSAYTDLEILQTPVFEAFTNNASSMKSKLLTVNLKNILHLPVMLINNKDNRATANKIINGGYIVAVDKTTEDYLLSSNTSFDSVGLTGVLRGFTVENSPIIRVDQGLNTDALTSLPVELKETQYILEVDSRLGTITDSNNISINPSYIDDDDIASYFVSLSTDRNLVMENNVSSVAQLSSAGQVISGPRGTMLMFGIESSLSLKTSSYLFNTIGITYTGVRSPNTSTLKIIMSNIMITGGTTGYTVSIPIAYAKLV